MSGSAFVEAAISLSFQTGVLVLITAWLVHKTHDERAGDRLWASCHMLIITLTFCALTFPHVRLLPHAWINQQADAMQLASIEDHIGVVALYVWACGAGIALLTLILGTVRVVRILAIASVIDSDSLLARCPGLDPFDGEGRSVRFLKSPYTGSPFCWQIHQSLIVLPNFVLEYDDEELRSILKHELAHLRAHHPLHLFVQRIVEILYWFHLLVWWSSHKAACYREFLCDSVSARSADEASACLRSLLRLAERGASVAGGLPAGLAFGAKHSLVRQRAERLAKLGERTGDVQRRKRLLMGILIGISILVSTFHLPIDAAATDRSLWSPWPGWTATALQTVGFRVRDYEIDQHRLEHSFHKHVDHN